MKDLNGDSRSEGQDLNPELPKKQPFLYRGPLKNSRNSADPIPKIIAICGPHGHISRNLQRSYVYKMDKLKLQKHFKRCFKSLFQEE
jgi:hypothetical protein